MLKKEKNQLYTIKNNIDEAIAFIASRETAIMRDTNLMSSDVFTSPYYPHKRYSIINKDIGSKLAMLFTAQTQLNKLIENISN